ARARPSEGEGSVATRSPGRGGPRRSSWWLLPGWSAIPPWIAVPRMVGRHGAGLSPGRSGRPSVRGALQPEPLEDAGGAGVGGLELLRGAGEQLGVAALVADDRHGGQAGERGRVGPVLLARGSPLVGRRVDEPPAQVELRHALVALAPADRGPVEQRQQRDAGVDVLRAQPRPEDREE